jgi:hypothetical protein
MQAGRRQYQVRIRYMANQIKLGSLTVIESIEKVTIAYKVSIVNTTAMMYMGCKLVLNIITTCYYDE